MNVKRHTIKPTDASRAYVDTFTVNQRAVTRGTAVTVAGIRGRCTVTALVVHASGAAWVDVITAQGRARTVRPETIKTVHRKAA